MKLKRLGKLNIPSVYIPLIYCFFCFLGKETGRAVTALVPTVLVCLLWIGTGYVFYLERRADLPEPVRQERYEIYILWGAGFLFFLFGVLFLALHLQVFVVLMDLFAGIAIILSFGQLEQRLTASCIALNIALMKANETLERSDNPYLLGRANIAVINPDIFARSTLLPPKFFYCGAIRHMSAINSADQRYLLQAIISCGGEGCAPSTFSELLVKNADREKEFRIIEQSEENGLFLSRQEFRGVSITLIRGSCEALVPKCELVFYDGQFAEIDPAEMKRIHEARVQIKDRGCQTYAYAMYLPNKEKTVFLGLVGFGMARETNIRKTADALRDAGMQICFAGIGGRETVFGMAESCGLSVTRFMTGREMTGRVIPPDSKEIASHRLFAELTAKEISRVMEAFRAEGWHPAMIGTHEIECDGAAVRAGFTGRESCEKLLMCVKLRRTSERAATGFAALRRCIGGAALLWPAIAALTVRSFICPILPSVAMTAFLFGWLTALFCSLMQKNSETPKDMGEDRKKNKRKGFFAATCWSLSFTALTIPLIVVPLMNREQAAMSVSISVAALLIASSLMVFSYACGIGMKPRGLLHKSPVTYGMMAFGLIATVLCFSIEKIAGGIGFASVQLGAWRIAVTYALMPLVVLLVFLFVEWLRSPGRGIQTSEVR